MAKYRYYVTDLFDGAIKGTDNEEAAKSYATCEDFFVVDSHTGEWLTSENDRQAIKDVEVVTE